MPGHEGRRGSVVLGLYALADLRIQTFAYGFHKMVPPLLAAGMGVRRVGAMRKHARHVRGRNHTPTLRKVMCRWGNGMLVGASTP